MPLSRVSNTLTISSLSTVSTPLASSAPSTTLALPTGLAPSTYSTPSTPSTTLDLSASSETSDVSTPSTFIPLPSMMTNEITLSLSNHNAVIQSIRDFLDCRDADVVSENGLSTHYILLLTGEAGSGKSWCVRKALESYDVVNLASFLDDYGQINHSLLFEAPNELQHDQHLDKHVKVLLLEDVEDFPKAVIQKLVTMIAPVIKRKTKSSEMRMNPIIITTSNSYDPNVGAIAGKLGLQRIGKKSSPTACVVEVLCKTPTEVQCAAFGRELIKAYDLRPTQVDLIDETNLTILAHQVYHAALCDFETAPRASNQEISLLQAWQYVTNQTGDVSDILEYSEAWRRAPTDLLKHVLWNSYTGCVDDLDQAETIAETWSTCDATLPYNSEENDLATTFFQQSLCHTFRHVKAKFRKGFSLTREPTQHPDTRGFSWADIDLFRELFAIKSCARTEEDDEAYALANFLRERCATLHNPEHPEPNVLFADKEHIGVWDTENVTAIAKIVTHRFV